MSIVSGCHEQWLIAQMRECGQVGYGVQRCTPFRCRRCTGHDLASSSLSGCSGRRAAVSAASCRVLEGAS